ncbi:MAG: hypothetical protein QOJ79_1127 [Actinomycetota bacterium]|jgi:hypothetical protein|nr:hypothetical protein [Actinomycetota bacterium]
MDSEEVRLQVYQAFTATGHAPTPAELAVTNGVEEGAVHAALRELAAGRHVVLADDGAIVMAHPFSSVPLGFSVMGRQTLWWGGCAWDSFALPHLLPDEPAVLVATRCPGCGRALAWNVGRDEPPAGSEVAHFQTPVAAMWDDVVSTCSNQRLFCSPDCVVRHRADTGRPAGYVMDLATLWRLAAHWYDGRLTRGYQRRDPAEATAYLLDVGLSGDFWGLE